MEQKMEKNMGGGNLVFAVNGERFEIPSIDPSTTLLEFLRSNTRFKSVKLGCGEGGCGACVVLLSKYDPVRDEVDDYTVNSCLTLLCSIHGCSVTTTEGLGSQKEGFHAIHQRMAGFHASQCGYCTPGMCVSLFSALINAEKSDGPEPPHGFSKLKGSEAEKAIAGNLCRCTGYRPIADACKSFAEDVDIEDLGFNAFWQKDENKDIKMSRLPVYDRSCKMLIFPDYLKNEIKFKKLLDSGKYSWHTPLSIEELHRKLERSEINNVGQGRVKLVVSNTGAGYYKELERYDTYIDLRYIPELSMVERDSACLRIGAAVSISKAIIVLKEGGKVRLSKGSTTVLKKIAAHFEKIASGSIRNSASIGGNLVMAQRLGFPSDIVTVLLAVDSSVELISSSKRETVKLEEFLARPPLDSKSVIVCVKIPIWEPSLGSNCKVMFETYRAAPRPLGNALAFLNAAFFAEVYPAESANGFMVNKIQLAFGAYGVKHAVRARKAEEFLSGKKLNHEVLHKTINLIQDVVVPEDGISHSCYRTSLAEAFVFEFLHTLIEPDVLSPSLGLNGCIDSLSRTEYQMKGYNTQPLLLPAKQVIVPGTEYHPVGMPIVKTGAALQASGEAIYVDDIPSPKECLHGAFVYSTKPLAKINCVRFESETSPEGFFDIVSYKDIPHNGKNVGAQTMFGSEILFSDDFARCAGERIALVVADTQKHADIAATKAVVEYDIENVEAPILTVEEAVERSSFFEIPSFMCPKPVGDFAKGMAKADQKILSAEIRLPSQYYFYMENQTALAIPDEDNCMTVYSSTQGHESTQAAIASCLGVPANNVRVITRRVGGGFFTISNQGLDINLSL